VSRKANLRFILPAIIVFAVVGQAYAGAQKEWVTLTECKYVENKDNDGDSFHVRTGDKEFTARFYFVDTPETSLHYGDRVRDQSLHFGITLDEAMNIGVKAKERVQELLKKPFVVQTRWANAAGRGRDERFYVIIEIDGKNLGETLISEGLARAKGVGTQLPTGEKSKEYWDKLDALEAAARAKKVGAWATSKGTPAPKPAE
jgi:endonuclease YncB( thermonuclease family)